MEEIKVNLENLKQEEREQLLALIKKANKPQSKAWKPKCGENYWRLFGDGCICINTWLNHEIDENRWLMGNCFRTREEAEFHKEKLLVTAELQRFADEHNKPIDWKCMGQPKWCFYYDCERKELIIYDCYLIRFPIIYFSSKEIAQKAIETIGEERIKKYYLGVTE